MYTRNAILLHGKPKQERFENPNLLNPADSNWFPWAKHQLTLNGIFTVTPDLPKPYAPVYDDWARELERHEIGPDTTLVGHSAGAALALKWLYKNPEVEIDKLVLVAPWLDPGRNYRPEFDFGFRSNLLRRIGEVTVFFSSNDDEQVLESLDKLKNGLDIPEENYLDYPAYGHYMLGNSMESVEFPELIAEIV